MRSFLLRRGRGHEHQLPRAKQAHQLLGDTTIGLDTVTRAVGINEGDHITSHASPILDSSQPSSWPPDPAS
jgi:hypothetical protein